MRLGSTPTVGLARRREAALANSMHLPVDDPEHQTVQQYSAMSCGGEYIDNLLDGFVGAVVCGFELAIWTVVRIRAVVEAAVGDRSAEPFMEEQK